MGPDAGSTDVVASSTVKYDVNPLVKIENYHRWKNEMTFLFTQKHLLHTVEGKVKLDNEKAQEKDQKAFAWICRHVDRQFQEKIIELEKPWTANKAWNRR